MSHTEHSQASQFLRGVKHHRREPTGHLTVKPDFDSGLNLVFAFDQQIEDLLSMDQRLTEVSAQADESSVPLVTNFGEGGTARRHQNVSHTVFEFLHLFLVHS